MKAAHPYLHFNGNCEEVFNFYRSVFGGDFLMLSRYKEVPSEHALPDKEREKIMHITLPLSKTSVLMGSDIPEAFPQAVRGSNYYIFLSTESEEETSRLFNSLSKDGVIAMPLEKTFWGAFFGMCIDKYGTQWMLSYDYNSPNA
jgi:PhnB protein